MTSGTNLKPPMSLRLRIFRTIMILFTFFSLANQLNLHQHFTSSNNSNIL